MMNRLSLAVVFLTIAGAPLAAGSIASFAIVNPSLGLTGGVFDDGGSYFGTFSLDTSQIPTLGGPALTLSSVDITTTPSGASPGAHFTSGVFAVEGTFTDPTSINNTQYDSDRILFSGQFPNLLELTLLERHGTFAGGQISDVTGIEAGIPSPSIRFDTSGRALLVDPALASPEPGTVMLVALGLAACLVRKRISGEAPSVSAGALALEIESMIRR